MLNEKEASQLSDTEFKAMVIRKLTEHTENYQKLQRNYNELTANYINMKKKIEITNKGQEEVGKKKKPREGGKREQKRKGRKEEGIERDRRQDKKEFFNKN